MIVIAIAIGTQYSVGWQIYLLKQCTEQLYQTNVVDLVLSHLFCVKLQQELDLSSAEWIFMLLAIKSVCCLIN